MKNIPVFRDQIRKYNENISEMKQMPAADFEDILQVSLHSDLLILTVLSQPQCAVPIL